LAWREFVAEKAATHAFFQTGQAIDNHPSQKVIVASSFLALKCEIDGPVANHSQINVPTCLKSIYPENI
jgi:hypothetical protein